MNIETKFFGEVEVEKSEIITFVNPILGFDNDKEFIFIDIEELDSLKCMQSVSNKNLCFIVSTPWVYYSEYAFDIDDECSKKLELDSEEQIEIYNILTLRDNFESSTINLLAPIILNHEKNLASQIVLNDDAYKTSHPIKRPNADSE